jgi:adenine nucleotide transporter 17
MYSGRELSSWAVFLIGAISKIIATFCTYPYTLLRTRQQIKTGKKGESLGWVFREILEKEGFKGVFKGLTPKLIQTTLNSALLLMIYEKIRAELIKLT